MPKIGPSQHILPGALAIVLPLSLFVWVVYYLLPFRGDDSQLSPLRCFLSIVVPAIMLVNAAKNKKLDSIAMLVAFIMGFIETLSNLCMIATTITFFMAGTKATKFKQSLKQQFDEDINRTGGKRNWIQVLSNGGVGMEISILMLIEKGPANEHPINFSTEYLSTWLSLAFLGSIACACGDTLASELAPSLTRAKPRLVTNLFRKVPRGTNGGVTIVGCVCSALGGFLCGFSYYLLIQVCISREVLAKSPPQWPLILLGTIAGFVGSFIDSLIGAIFQFSGFDHETGRIVGKSQDGVEKISGLELLDNHSVNLMSTLLTALISPYIGKYIWVRA